MTIFFKHFGIRIIAILCAILLWLFVVLGKKYETTISVPIQLINVPTNLAAANRYPDTAKVLVSGTGKQLIMTYFSKPSLRIPCIKAKPGNITFKLDRKNVYFKKTLNISVLYVRSPSQLSVNFDAIVKKNLPINLNLVLSLDNNKTISKETRITPNTVAVIGPRCNLSHIKILETQLAEIHNLKNDTSFFIFLKRPNLHGIEIIPNKIKVTINIESITKRHIKNIPVHLIGIPKGVMATLDKRAVSIVIAGAAKDVKGVKKELINIFVNYSRFSIEQLDKVQPTVSILGNVEWSNMIPATVKLKKR